MNGAFLIGVSIVLLEEVVRFRRALFADFDERRFWQKIIVGMPAFGFLAFFAGTFVEWWYAKPNYVPQFTVFILCWVLAALGEQVIETNGSIMRRYWNEDCGGTKYSRRAALLLTLMLTLALMPYVLYVNVYWSDNPLWIYIAAAALWLGFASCGYYFFQRNFKAETEFMRERMRAVLLAICNSHSVAIDTNARVKTLLRTAVEDLETIMRLTRAQRIAVMHCQLYSDHPAPGLEGSRLSPQCLRSLAEEVQTELLGELEARQFALCVLIGDDGECADAEDALAVLARSPARTNAYSKALKELQQRRRDLKSSSAAAV